MRIFLLSMLFGGSLVVAGPGTPSPENPDWFPFPISVMDGSKTPVDLSFLNDKPAGGGGFLRADGGHIVNERGARVRLFGTNFCGGACFPDPADAAKVAAHLAKNGVNVVRLHHMDNDWNESLIEDNAATRLHADRLSRLDRLASELIKQGIYINLNLHVSRTYPGTPKGAPNYSKGLDYFHPPFIAAFKDYARAILDHVNPHTGRAWKDEPGIAIIEMNNENTLVLNPWWMSTLPEPFAGELRALFIKHLRAKYPTTEKLREVWGVNDGGTGPDLIKNGAFAEGPKHWASEANFGAVATLAKMDGGGIRWTSTRSGGQPWALQFSQSGLRLEETKAYRLSFRARSERKAALDVHAQNAGEPWAQLGLQEKVELAPEWRSFSFEFAPHSVLPDGKNRVVFSLLNAVSSVEISDVTLVSISTGQLTPGQTLEAGDIPVPSRNAKLAVRRDFFDFLMALEIEHALAMKRFLREEIGARQMISHSQVLFGGIAGARREFQVSDVVDTHGYWHHPHFPNKPWDMGDWTINNVSQISSADGGTLAEMAMQRPLGKPYSVSEYDTPAPNDHAAETFPLFATMACLQDWSALYHFNFKHGSNYDSDRITSFFDLPGHPGKQAFVPLAALVFRGGLISSARSSSALPLGKEEVLEFAAAKSGDVWGGWRDVWGAREATGAEAWQSSVGFEIVENAAPGGPARITAADARSGTQRDVAASVLRTAPGENAIVIAGNAAGRAAASGGAEISVESPHAVVMLAPLDGKSLAESRKLWLCALSRAENPGMEWDNDRRTVGKKWGTGPALVLGVKARIKLPGAPTWKIEALDPTGAPKAIIGEMAGGFDIQPSQRTVWWLATRE